MPSYSTRSPPLRIAFQRYVRQPLKKICGQDWETSGGAMLSTFQQWANRGQISEGDSEKAVLCSTLLYGCMHFDALTVLMNTSTFGAHVPTQDAVLHIDLGCGPGTASWTLANRLQNKSYLTTIGHDHNPRMVKLAEDMTSCITNEMSIDVTSAFHYDWVEFQTEVVSRVSSHPKAVLMTANSLFGQNRVDIDSVIEFIGAIRDNARGSLFVLGTHPPYNEELVVNAWNRIGDLSGSEKLYEERLSIESGNFRGYDDTSCWEVWRPDPQLAHIFKLPTSELANRSRDEKHSLRAWLT